MPADSGILRFRSQRPRTCPAANRRLAALQVPAVTEEAREDTEDQEDHQIELLEYEWPDMPPLPSIKDAITRNRVSYGISYLLPVDKGCNSINNRFRTDLRAMFQVPYISDDLQYDDSRVQLSSRIHFPSNSADAKWTRRHLKSLPVELNAESERMRRMYSHSAPSGGRASGRMGIDSHRLKTRSTLFLPLKADVPLELIKLRKEVEEIIKSVQEDDEAFDEQQQKNERIRDSLKSDSQLGRDGEVESGKKHPDVSRQMSRDGGLMTSQGTHVLTAKLQNMCVSPQRYNSYEELKAAKPPRPQIPDCIKSEYLDHQQNQHIWEWLHYGEGMTDFDFFLSVCG